MADTNAPPGVTTEQTERLDRIRTLMTDRQRVLDQLRWGDALPERDAVLLELCGYRDMTYTEAAALVGMTREGVARRIRPEITKLGLDGLSWSERQKVGIDRPLKDRTADELLAALAPRPKGEARQVARDLAKDAREMRKEMTKLIGQLKAEGMSYVEQAEHLGVSVPTIQRIRGVM